MRRFLTAVCALQFASCLLAQSTTTGTATGTATTSASPSVHTIAVGANGYMYTPNTTLADVGDIIVFDFYPTNHSVIRGEYTESSTCGTPGCNPCVPYELYHANEPYHGFFSKNRELDSFTNRMQWNLTINNTDAIWFYCDALTSCHPNGMVGVINPANGTSLETQHNAAVAAAYQLGPGQSWPAEGTSGSKKHSSSSSLSGGAIAGIVVGGVAFLAVCAALTFYIGRSRAYDRMFKHHRTSRPPGGTTMSETGESGVSRPSQHPWFDNGTNTTPSRMNSPPPPMGSPPLGSEKTGNNQRWSDSTAMSGMQQQQRGGMPSPGLPQEGSIFVGYNRQTGAPEFAPELPGDHEIHQIGPQLGAEGALHSGSPPLGAQPQQQQAPGRGQGQEHRFIGRSPVEMEAPSESRWARKPRGLTE